MFPIRVYNTNSQSARSVPISFAKMVTGADLPQEAVLVLDKFKASRYATTYADRDEILKAIENKDSTFLRGMSNYFYDGVSGMYRRFIEYFAGLPTYAWYVYPYLQDDKTNVKTVKKELYSILGYMDNLFLKTTLYNISIKVLVNGVFYGYMVNKSDNTTGAILELPVKYCRSRYAVNNQPAVEFNLKYFDMEFPNKDVREHVLAQFPKEFIKAYSLYLAGGIARDPIDSGYWFVCDKNLAMRFSFANSELPFFASVVPAILELEAAKQLDMKKTMQELLKIVIQTLPLDKNNEMVFDLDEATALHNNVCRMLTNAVGVDVLTTFGEIDVANLESNAQAGTKDPLVKVERAVFNEAGVSQNMFATDGNIALERSINNDEALMFFLIKQYQNMLNTLIDFSFNKKIKFKVSIPDISVYNYEKKTRLFKELASAGYSKLLVAIASGMSQSEFLSLNNFENIFLELPEKMQPLQISSTQSAKTTTNAKETDKKVGAPEKDPTELSEKTIQNKESLT